MAGWTAGSELAHRCRSRDGGQRLADTLESSREELDPWWGWRVRPSWHVDVKWILGLMLTALLGIGLVVHTAWRMTSPAIGIELTTVAVATAFSPHGLDDPGEIEQLRQQMRREGVSSIDPLGNGATITRADLDELSPREVRLKIFGAAVEDHYYGSDEATVAADAGVAAFDQVTHRRLGMALAVVVALVALAAWGLVRFSSGRGRLVSPSVVLLVPAMPYVAVAAMMLATANDAAGTGASAPGEAPDEMDLGARLGAVASETLPLVARAVLPVPLAMIAAAVIMLATAGVLALRARVPT
jgi:hypothetical protein